MRHCDLLLTASVSLLFVWRVQATQPPVKPIYSLEQREGRSGVTLRLFRAFTGRTIWTRKVRSVAYSPDSDQKAIEWSPNGKSLAVGVSTRSRPLNIQILTWRSGHRPYIHPQWLLGDGIQEMIWSEDGTALLFRVGGSGSFDLNTGSLYCLDEVKQKMHHVTTESVRRMQWVGARKVHYWLESVTRGNKLELVTDSKPRLWKLP